jgi:hypothetical protein
MHSDFGRRGRFSRRLLSPRLGLSVGLVAAGVSGLLPSVGRAEDPPGVVFLLDNSEAMQDYPEYLPEAYTPGYYPTPSNPLPDEPGGEGSGGRNINTGCSDPALVSAMSWFDKDSTNPAKNGSIVYDSDSDLITPFFEPNKFYLSRGRRLAWGVKENPAALVDSYFTTLNSYSDALNACYSNVGWGSDYRWMAPIINECTQCLTTKGWWRGPIVTSNTSPSAGGPTREPGEAPLPPEAFRKWIVSGRVLNVRPPKFVIARKALKELIASASNVRMGVATFGKDHGWYDPPELLAPVRPSCDLSSPTINEAALDRPGLMRAVNKTRFRNNERSLGEALFGLGGYFSSQVVDNKWANWFQQPISPGAFGWPGCCNGGTYDNPYTGQDGMYWGVASDEWLKPSISQPWPGDYLPGQPWEGSGTSRSVCTSYQPNAVIVVTGGRPYYDNTVPITKMMDILKANGARHPNGALLTFDPMNPETNPNPGGVNYCNLFGATKEACDYTDYNWPTGLAKTNKNFMDDVAFFLSHTDLRGDMPGSQTVRTFVIGYGDSNPLLQSIALAGRGRFYRADQPAALREALSFALGEISAPACSTP